MLGLHLHKVGSLKVETKVKGVCRMHGLDKVPLRLRLRLRSRLRLTVAFWDEVIPAFSMYGARIVRVGNQHQAIVCTAATAQQQQVVNRLGTPVSPLAGGSRMVIISPP